MAVHRVWRVASVYCSTYRTVKDFLTSETKWFDMLQLGGQVKFCMFAWAYLQYGLHSAVYKLKLSYSVVDCMLLLAQEMESQRASMSASINLTLITAVTNSGVPTICSGKLDSGKILLGNSHHCERVPRNSIAEQANSLLGFSAC